MSESQGDDSARRYIGQSLEGESSKWVDQSTLHPTYVDALVAVEGLRGYVADGGLLEDMRRTKDIVIASERGESEA